MRRSTLVLGASLLVAPLAFGAGGPAAKGGVVEMPMHVRTEGTTYAEYRAHQNTLMTRLAGSASAAALNAPIRVELTLEESDAIERAPRVSGTPQQIGLVKAVTPRVDITGLQIAPDARGPRRGPRALAVPTPDGGFVWAVTVTSASAGALRLHLENVSLPARAALFFYSPSGEAFGPYVGNGPDGDGDLWTDTLFGMEGILQLHVSGPATAADLDRVSFSVTGVGIVAPRFAGSFTPEAGICGDPDCVVDANCVSGTPADPAKSAVAKMEWAQGNFLYTCTGGLIADNIPSSAPYYFLTAAHCVGNNKTARNLQFYWRFATTGCNGTCPMNGGWPYRTSGSTLATTGKKGDFTLLRLDASPPAGSVFLGWTTNAVAFTNGADLYRISNPNFSTQVYSKHDVDSVFSPCGGWPRGAWIYSRDLDGAIDGGSSGSPIVNDASQIVGQLSGTCGGNPSDPCSSGPGEANATVDGAFAFYYASVQPFINP